MDYHARMPRSGFIFAAVGLVFVMSLGYACADVTQAEPGPQGSPTPASTEITPVHVTAVAEETAVTPITGQAEATSGPAQADPEVGDSSGLFTGVRGGLIGAGIALGIVVVVTVLVRGIRAAFACKR
jgi:hypothetical protein